MGVTLHATSGPAIEHKGALAGLLTKLEAQRRALHRRDPPPHARRRGEPLPAIEDFRIDIMTGDGPYATTHPAPLKPFTLVGATTRTGPAHGAAALALRLRDAPRFLPPRISSTIVLAQRAPARRAHRRPGRELEIAARARHAAHREPPAPPRARLRRGARHRGHHPGDRQAPRPSASRSTPPASTRWIGASPGDHRVLRRRPVGVDTIAAALSEPRDTIEDVYEPFLLQQGFLGPHPARPRRHAQGLRAPRKKPMPDGPKGKARAISFPLDSPKRSKRFARAPPGRAGSVRLLACS
jgi:Holliday junction DNA helicase RuvB